MSEVNVAIEATLAVLGEQSKNHTLTLERIENSTLTRIEKKIDDQGVSMICLTEWKAVHEEQAQARTRHISENETRLSRLEQDLKFILMLANNPKLTSVLVVGTLTMAIITSWHPLSDIFKSIV